MQKTKKRTKQLRLVTETVRSLVPGELSQINGGGGNSILTEARMTGTVTQVKPPTTITE